MHDPCEFGEVRASNNLKYRPCNKNLNKVPTPGVWHKLPRLNLGELKSEVWCIKYILCICKLIYYQQGIVSIHLHIPMHTEKAQTFNKLSYTRKHVRVYVTK